MMRNSFLLGKQYYGDFMIGLERNNRNLNLKMTKSFILRI